MARRGFWTKERMLPGQETGEEVHATYSMLKLFHPPSASALALGAVAGVWLAWKLLRDLGWPVLLLGLFAGFVVGAVVGLVGYWLVRWYAGEG